MGKTNEVYIIAEVGVNHNGDLSKAFELVDVAKQSGTDAVKFQLFSAEKLVRKATPMTNYQRQNLASTQTQFELLKHLELSTDDVVKISRYCKKCNIDLIVTPFDEESAIFLIDELKLKRVKISSGDLNNAPLLLTLAKRDVDFILSTGMATLAEVQQALGVIAFGYYYKHEKPSAAAFALAYQLYHDKLLDHVTLLHCTSEYPAPFDAVNLKAIETLRRYFNLPVGFSDHTEGISISTAAAALDAKIIEKHITLDKTLPGPDHKASINPDELHAMVNAIRAVSVAIGSGEKGPMCCEMNNRRLVRKSIVAKCEIKAGESFSENNLTVMRPADGVEPVHYWRFLGQKALQDYHIGDAIK